MDVCIQQDDSRQKDNPTRIKFVKEGEIFFCFQKPDHKSHKKTNTQDLEYKIHVWFKEEIFFAGSIEVKLFCEQHEPKKKSISSIIEEFPIAPLEKIRKGKKDHH